jgi:hypothetical protein
MSFMSLDVDYERVIADLNDAVAAVRYALAAPDPGIRRVALKEALNRLDRAVIAAKDVDVTR